MFVWTICWVESVLGASLVIQTSFLGALVLTTPLLAELATRGPVDVVVTNIDLLSVTSTGGFTYRGPAPLR